MRILFIAFVFLFENAAIAQEFELFIIAGQSNAQGWKGDAVNYPKDLESLDKSIPFYWVAPKYSSSNSKWTTLKAQKGVFKKGHFGPEVTFARALKKQDINTAIFKYTQSSTDIIRNWKAPGQNGLYDKMVQELNLAIRVLREEGHKVKMSGFVWIQGESDAKNEVMADTYYKYLKRLIDDVRQNVSMNLTLPVILGVDEQNPWVKKNQGIVQAQKQLAQESKDTTFVSMLGLEKADATHLTPRGLEMHGKRLFIGYKKLTLISSKTDQ